MYQLFVGERDGKEGTRAHERKEESAMGRELQKIERELQERAM